MRKTFILVSTLSLITAALLGRYLNPNWYVVLAVLVALTVLGWSDMLQTRHSVKRIYPVLGRLRYVMEELRPKIYQYFIESDIDGRPVNRIDRSTIYQRSKRENDTMPFGTQLDVYAGGYEWMCHSIAPKDFLTLDHDPRVTVGNTDCAQPYSCSIYNVCAMSYGALSANAVQAMNAGAKIGGFCQNTRGGALSPQHLQDRAEVDW